VLDLGGKPAEAEKEEGGRYTRWKTIQSERPGFLGGGRFTRTRKGKGTVIDEEPQIGGDAERARKGLHPWEFRFTERGCTRATTGTQKGGKSSEKTELLEMGSDALRNSRPLSGEEGKEKL